MQKTVYHPHSKTPYDQSIINIISLKNQSLSKSRPHTQNKSHRRKRKATDKIIMKNIRLSGEPV